MKQKRLGKRIAAWFMCLAMVLTTINLPAFTTEVKAEEAPKCGENAYYAYDETSKTLRIYGSGSLYNDAFNVNYGAAVNLNNDEQRALIARDMKKVIIGKDITGLAEHPFYGYGLKDDATNSQLETVEFEEGSKITNIGTNAFCYCKSLSSFSMPDSVKTIGDSAFSQCENLSSVELSNNLETIGNEAFSYCKSLSSFSMSDSVKTLGSNAFKNCESLASVTLSNNLETIGDETFSYCKSLSSFSMPDSVKTLGSYAFNNCESLASVTLSNNLETIGYEAFDLCKKLENVVIPPSVTTIEGFAFAYCDKLLSISIANPLVEIGDDSLDGDYNLENVHVSCSFDADTVGYGEEEENASSYWSMRGVYDTSIVKKDIHDFSEQSYEADEDGIYHNQKCKNCDFVNQGNHDFSNETCQGICNDCGAKNINGNHDFSDQGDGTHKCADCNVVESHEFTDGVCACGYIDPAVGGAIFDKEYKCPCDETCTDCSCGIHEFCEKTHIVSLKTPIILSWSELKKSENGDKYQYNASEISDASIGNAAFRDCSGLTNITIPKGVTCIGDNAFNTCSGLNSIIIPEGVASVGNYAFSNCTELTSITILEGVTSIGNAAFNNCTNITSIIIPESVTSIGDSAFRKCTELTSITIPDSVTSIGEYAFSDCFKLTSITIPKGVTSIGKGIINACVGLKELKVDENNAIYTSRDTSGKECNAIINRATKTLICGMNRTIIPSEITAIGDSAFFSHSNLVNITIPEGITSIGEDAFCDCTELTSITIPDSVASIGDYAFNYCSKLKEITIKNPDVSLGLNMFDGCESLETIILSCKNENVAVGKESYWTDKMVSNYQDKVKLLHNYVLENDENHKCADCGVTDTAGHVDENNDGKCDVCSKYVDNVGASLAGYSLSLEGNIGVKFYMELESSVASDENAYMNFTLPNGETEKVYVKDAKKETVKAKKYYVFDCHVSAKEMTGDIKGQMVPSNGSKGTVYTYTVEDYAKYILDNTEKYDSETVSLVKSMLNYGAKAQEYFDHKTDALANRSLDEADKTLSSKDSIDLSGYAYTKTKVEDATATFKGSNVTLKSKPIIKLYFESENELALSDFTVKVGEADVDAKNLSVGTDNNGTYIKISNIVAGDFGKGFNVSCGGTTVENFSIYSYLNKALKSENTKLVDIARAMYDYNEKAKAYSSK